jgi:hypothetical protein
VSGLIALAAIVAGVGVLAFLALREGDTGRRCVSPRRGLRPLRRARRALLWLLPTRIVRYVDTAATLAELNGTPRITWPDKTLSDAEIAALHPAGVDVVARFRADYERIRQGSGGRPPEPLPPLRWCCPSTEFDPHTHRCEAVNVPAREVAESARGLGSLEKIPAAGAAPVISETGAVPPVAAMGRHAASLPRRTMYPLRTGEGLVMLGPEGFELIPREAAPGRADKTLCDLPAVRSPRYLAEMPGGTNG